MEPLSQLSRPLIQPLWSREEEQGVSSTAGLSRARMLDVVHEPGAGGPWNMAFDEALARRATNPALRVYVWPSREVTFGYGQRAGEIVRLAGDAPATRRLTGGGLVRHGEDITITIFLPRDAVPFPRRVRDGYRLLHSLLHEALAEMGIESLLCAERSGGSVCFEAPVCDDLIAPVRPTAARDAFAQEMRKIAGGAQRRLREGLLHQGSLAAPGLPSTPENAALLASVFAEKLADALGGLQVTRRMPLESELQSAASLLESRYARPEWNFMR